MSKFGVSQIPSNLKLKDVTATVVEHGELKIAKIVHHPTAWSRSVRLDEIDDELQVELGLKKKARKTKKENAPPKE